MIAALFVLLAAVAPNAPPDVEAIIDLSALRTIAVVPSTTYNASRHEEVRAALAQLLPELLQVPRDEAELVIEYSESFSVDPTYVETRHNVTTEFRLHDLIIHFDSVEPEELDSEEPEVPVEETVTYVPPATPTRIAWEATLFRLDCQSPNFGELPTPAVNGSCENRVYVRVKVGTLSGTADDSASAIDAFTLAFRDAVYVP